MQLDVERVKREVMEQLEHWLPQLQTGPVNHVQVDIRNYRKDGEQVRSSGTIDPQRR